MKSNVPENIFGGYKVEWFVDKPSLARYICVICQNVVKNPKQCQKGHLFCENCIKVSLKRHRICPDSNCSEWLKENSLAIAKCVHDIIDDLKVKCNIRADLDCGWTGALHEHETHLKETCPLAVFDCPLFALGCKPCKKKYHRRDLANHLHASTEQNAEHLLILASSVNATTAENNSLNEHYVDGYTAVKLANGEVYSGQTDASKAHPQHGLGIQRHPGKRTYYAGEWDDGMPDGHAVWKLSASDVYYGRLSQGQMNGFGVMDNTAEGTRYSGDWRNSVYHGKGTKNYSNGDVYTGDFYRDLRDGNGLMRYKAGKVESYEGQWKDGEWDGKGVVVYCCGDRYEGQCKDWKMNGTGKLVYAWGSVYEGEMEDNKRHGSGVIRHLSGDKYDGEWADDKHHGTGTLTSSNGTSYTGGWSKGFRHGKGVQKYVDGDIYDGDFHMGARHGTGTLTAANGTRYTGDFVKDKKEGRGVQTFPSGTVYSGGFQNNLMHGIGEMRHKNALKVVHGVWKDGRKEKFSFSGPMKPNCLLCENTVSGICGFCGNEESVHVAKA